LCLAECEMVDGCGLYNWIYLFVAVLLLPMLDTQALCMWWLGPWWCVGWACKDPCELCVCVWVETRTHFGSTLAGWWLSPL
jgi:hypothetical protein